MLQLCDPYGWHAADQATIHKIRERLRSFETMTWGEILNEGGKRNHLIHVSDLCREAKQQLRTIGQDDLDQLLSLGLTGQERIWGILENGVVRLLWWDPEHRVCPSHKKNT